MHLYSSLSLLASTHQLSKIFLLLHPEHFMRLSIDDGA